MTARIVPETAAAPEPGDGRPVASAVHSGWYVVGAVLAAGFLGVATALAPLLALGVVVGGSALVVLVARVHWAVLLYVAVAPFESYLLGLHPMSVKALSGLLVLSWVFFRLRERHLRPLGHAVTWSVLALTVALLVSTLVHANPSPAGQILLRYLGFIVALVVIADVVRNRLEPIAVVGFYVAGCTVASVCGLVSWVVLDQGRVGGPIEDPNDFAFYLVAAVPLGAALLRTARHRLWSVLALLVMITALAGTLSRGALVGLVVLGIYATLAGFVRIRTVVGIVLAAAVVATFFALAFPDRVERSMSDKEDVASQNVDERYQLWQTAGEMTLHNPLTGLGPAGFQQHHDDYISGHPLEGVDRLDVVHNMYLETSAELGVPGLLALLAMLGTGIGAATRRWSADRTPLAAAVAAALVGVCAAACFLSEQYFLPIWLLCALATALWPLPERAEGSRQLVRTGVPG